MRILFIHQNFPGQFKHLAPALAAAGHEVRAISMRDPSPELWQGVRIHRYGVRRPPGTGLHPWLSDLEPKLARAEAVQKLAIELRGQGFTPDVVVAHPGWGESLFVKDVWPGTRLGMYCEFHYQLHGHDVGFDPEFPSEPDVDGPRLAMKNLLNLAHFQFADGGLSPTRFQADTYPQPFRQRISVIHDGIDTETIRPRPDARVTISLASGQRLALGRDSEVLTFVNRNLEPYRGYHVFCRMLPALLARRPQLRVLVVGGDEVSYGTRPAHGRGWREHYFAEVAPQLSTEQRARVHFLGHVAYPVFIEMLQVSTVHLYLSYPFVLSWSLLEAMSAGCAIVGSDTAPVAEVIRHGETGLLAGFFDRPQLVEHICRLLDEPAQRAELGRAAREVVQTRFDLKSHCLPAQLAWLQALAS